MKPLLWAGLALVLCATSAFAVGADLSVIGCPGNAGATNDAGNFDCAGGAGLVLLVTFMPAESAPDLAGIDVVVDFHVGGDLNGNANFWDFESANNAALINSHNRPFSLCTNYTNTWLPSGSGEGIICFKMGPSIARIKALAYRPNNLAYTTNQRLFGMSILMDGGSSMEAGGNGAGCTLPVCFLLSSVFPRLASGNPTQELITPSVFGNQVVVNGSTNAPCSAVPARKQTWGRLKALYR